MITTEDTMDRQNQIRNVLKLIQSRHVIRDESDYLLCQSHILILYPSSVYYLVKSNHLIAIFSATLDFLHHS